MLYNTFKVGTGDPCEIKTVSNAANATRNNQIEELICLRDLPKINSTNLHPSFLGVVSALEAGGYAPKKSGNGYTARCPAHDDHNPSLSINPKDDGSALLNCFSNGCKYEDILSAIGLWTNPADIERKEKDIPYHVRKRVKLHSPANINEKNNLIVPCKDIDGNEKGFIEIFPNPFKQKNGGWNDKFFRGKDTNNWTFLFGAGDAMQLSQSDSLLVATGYSTAASISESTGAIVVMVTCDNGMTAMIPQLRKKYPDKELTICADYDARDKFNSLALQYHCLVCHAPMVNNNPKSDFNDLMVVEGKGAVCDVIGEAKFVTAEPVKESVSSKPESPPQKKNAAAKIMTAAELWQREFKPIKMIITPILPEGVTLLVSAPKIGKTRLAGQLALATASGGYALNHKDTLVNKTKVLFMALESGDRRAQKDLKQMIENPPDGLFIVTEWPRLNDGGATALEQWLDDNPDCTLVIIDTVAKVRDSNHGSNGFMYTADYEAGAAIKSIADKRGISILLLHHANKMNDDGKDLMDTVSGSTGVTGSVDHILFLKRNRLEEDGLMTLISRDFEDRQFAMTFKDGLWTLIGQPDEAAGEGWRGDGSSNARSEILIALHKEPMKPADLAVTLGKNPTTVRRLLQGLSEAGKVRKRFDGKYSIL